MKTYGIKKATIRLTVKLPDNYGTVQRLYDYGTRFDLREEKIYDVDRLIEFINDMKARGAKLIDKNEFIDEDDLEVKQTYTFELII